LHETGPDGDITVELAPAETRSYTSEQLGIPCGEETGPVPFSQVALVKPGAASPRPGASTAAAP